MARRPTSTTMLVTLAVALLAAAAAGAQPVSPACQENCPTCGVGSPPSCVAQATACAARIADCTAKLTAFNGYIAQMRAGVPRYSLTSTFRDVLSQFYSVNLGQWEFGYSYRQPPNNATTPCDETYFNDSPYVDALGAGTVDRSWTWLFHEIAHYEQCQQVGGYDFFAKMWWDHLSVSAVESSNLEELHDQMQMEQQAESKAQQVFAQFAQCCLDPSTNRLIRPLEVTPISLSYSPVHVGNPLTVSVQVSDGPPQQTAEWYVKPPNASLFSPAGSVGTVASSGESFTWTPDSEGTWTVRFSVNLPTPLTDHREDRQIGVTEPWDGTTGDDYPELGRLLRQIQNMEVVQTRHPGSPPGDVCLSCPRSFATQGIRDALDSARIRSEVTVTIARDRTTVADLGRHRPDRSGRFSTLRSTTTVRPRGEFRDPADGCGYTIVVKDTRGRTVVEEPTCLDLR